MARGIRELPRDIQRLLQPAIDGFSRGELNQAAFSLMQGGNDAQIYKADVGSRSYVCRAVRDANELRCWRLAADCNAGPPVAFPSEEEEGSVVVLEYLIGRHLPFEVPERRLDLIPQTLKAVHATNAPGIRAANSRFDVIRWYLDQSRTRVDLEVARSQLQRIERAVRTRELEPRFTHNDLHRGNVLVTEESVYFIDWSTAGMGDPLADLAFLVRNLGLDNDQSDAFLHRYLFPRRPTLQDTAHFHLMDHVSHLNMAAFALFMGRKRGYEVVPTKSAMRHRTLLADDLAGRWPSRTVDYWNTVTSVGLGEFHRGPDHVQELVNQCQS